MSKICYLHIGFHKTASTSFQVTCAKNKKLLSELGITYPLFSDRNNNLVMHNHSILVESLFADDPIKYLSSKKKWCFSDDLELVYRSYESQFSDYLDNSQDLIISGETISTFSEKSLSRLIKKIQEYNYELKVFALVRSPYSAFCSGMQQLIKRGSYFELLSLNDCTPKHFDASRFSKLMFIKNLQSSFGNLLTFHTFENACAHPYGPVGFIFDKFLKQDPKIFAYENKNMSMFNLSIRIQNEFNKIYPAWAKGKNNDQFRPFPPLINEKFDFSGKFLLTEKEYALVQDFIVNEIKILKNIDGLDFSAQPIKFSEPIY